MRQAVQRRRSVCRQTGTLQSLRAGCDGSGRPGGGAAAEKQRPIIHSVLSASQQRRPPEETKPARISIHINPGLIVLALVLIAIPTAIYLVEQGPIKAKHQWEAVEPTAEGNIISQITRAIQYVYGNSPFGTDKDAVLRCKALNAVFDEPVIMIRLPDSVQVQGRTTEGLYRGVFYPRTMRFEALVPALGRIHQVDGSVTDEDQSLNLDGQKIN